MRFRTQFGDRVRVHAEPGSRIHDIYTPKYDENGVMDLVVTGRENIYEYIQSHRDSVDLHVILDRYARGDVSALSRVQGAYGDFTTVPKSYAEALNAVISAENYFNSLPLDVRARFDHSFQKFLVSMDKPGFADAMRFEAPTTTPPVSVANTEGEQHNIGNVIEFPKVTGTD